MRKPARLRKSHRAVTRLSTLTRRGFACIALDRPQDPVNVGHTLRAALCFQADLVILGAKNPKINVRKLPTDPSRAYRHVPVIDVENVLDAVPADTRLIAVEITDDAVDLNTFKHPERACYVFGPERGHLDEAIRKACESTVKIPTTISLNLGMTVNLVLYDRLASRGDKRS